MRLASHECRWFFTGVPDEEVVRRFKTGGAWKRSSEIPEPSWSGGWRGDRYELLPRGVDPRDVDLGIKLRDEALHEKPLKLEYKARTATLGPVRFAASAIGIVERWIKWSYEADHVPAALWRPFDDGEIGIPVRKNRMRRKIRLDALDDDEEVPIGGPELLVDRGMGFELTRIRLEGGEEHWTFGLEAFPHDTGIHEDFLRNARRLLADFAAVATLSEATSMSYPQWLSGLQRE